VHGLGASFRNHPAHSVVDRLGARLTGPTASRVRHLFAAHLTFVPDTVHNSFLYLRHPDLLADPARRALHFDGAAFTRNIDAAATAGIPLPATWFLDAFADHRTRALGHLGVPVTAANLDRLGVMHWFAN
jgi:hypothetical protein